MCLPNFCERVSEFLVTTYILFRPFLRSSKKAKERFVFLVATYFSKVVESYSKTFCFMNTICQVRFKDMLTALLRDLQFFRHNFPPFYKLREGSKFNLIRGRLTKFHYKLKLMKRGKVAS